MSILGTPPVNTPMYMENGQMQDVWKRWFAGAYDVLGADSSSFAPSDGRYVVLTATADLSNEFILGNLSSGVLAVTTGTGILTPRAFVAPPVGGISITNTLGEGNIAFNLVNDLSALEQLSSTGIAVRSATDTWVQRTLTGTTDKVTITNGDGVSGNPTVTIASTYAGQSSITILGTIATGVWQGTSISTTYTDAKVKTLTGTSNRVTISGTSTDPIVDISAAYVGQTSITTLGTIGAALNMGTHQINNVVDPTSAQDAATKSYVDTALTGFQIVEQVQAATTATLVGTYNNGSSGVGATFTLTALGALTIDGQAIILNQRYLLKDQTSGFQNGVYTCTTLGAIGIAAVFTRAVDFNTAAEMDSGCLIPCINGTVNANKIFLQSATIVTVGTDNLVFAQFGLAGALLSANNLSDLSNTTTARTNLGLGTLAVLSDPLALNKGGTAAALTASNGGIVYSTASALAILGGTATASKMLLSAASTTPTWSTSTIPTSAGATANKVLLSDGTNYVLSTPTFPNASATSGKFIRSDGTNWVASTPTLPTSAGSAGKVLASDGTNYIESTPTFPYSVSATSGKIIKSDGTNWIASTETYAAPSTSGKIMQSDGTNWTSATPTGTGTPVLATSPTLVTPLLGTVTSGVISACTSTSMVMVTPVLGTPTSGTLTNCTGYTDANLSTSDITTNDVSTSKHGFAPKLPNDSSKFLNGTGAYSVPTTAGVGRQEIVMNGATAYGSTANKIAYFPTTESSNGTDISVTTGSTNGTLFTINTAGIYSVTTHLVGSGAGYIGISVNAGNSTTAIYSVTAANILVFNGTGNGSSGGCSTTRYFAVNDTIRSHTDGFGLNGSAANCKFSIARVA